MYKSPNVYIITGTESISLAYWEGVETTQWMIFYDTNSRDDYLRFQAIINDVLDAGEITYGRMNEKSAFLRVHCDFNEIVSAKRMEFLKQYELEDQNVQIS